MTGPTASRPERGVVRTLCDEIGFEFDPRLERPDVLVAFVRQLVAEVESMRLMEVTIAERLGGKPPSPGSLTVLNLSEGMLSVSGHRALIGGSVLVHEACHRLNPEDAYPTDHLIDMLSSCASAVRFGLETPCRSRHAAEAASHVFRRLYGPRIEDSRSSAWEKDWARSKLLSAIVSMLPPLSDGALGRQDETVDDAPRSAPARSEGIAHE